MNMKTLRAMVCKSLASLFLTLAVAAVLAPRSYANVDQAQQWFGQIAMGATRLGGVAGTANQSNASTTTVVMELYYNGPAAGSYVTIGATSITFYAPFGVVDTSLGTAGVFDFSVSTFNTLGQLCDAINTQGMYQGHSRYHCTLRDGIRSDLTANYLPAVTAGSLVNNLAGTPGYEVPVSTGAIMSLGIIPAQGRHVILNYAEVNSAGTPTVQVYGVLAKFGAGVGFFGQTLTDSTLVWQSPPLVANTNTFEPTVGTTYPAVPGWLEFGNPGGAGGNAFSYINPPIGTAYNGHVTVRVSNYGLGAALQAATNFLIVEWDEK